MEREEELLPTYKEEEMLCYKCGKNLDEDNFYKQIYIILEDDGIGELANRIWFFCEFSCFKELISDLFDDINFIIIRIWIRNVNGQELLHALYMKTRILQIYYDFNFIDNSFSNYKKFHWELTISEEIEKIDNLSLNNLKPCDY